MTMQHLRTEVLIAVSRFYALTFRKFQSLVQFGSFWLGTGSYSGK